MGSDNQCSVWDKGVSLVFFLSVSICSPTHQLPISGSLTTGSPRWTHQQCQQKAPATLPTQMATRRTRNNPSATLPPASMLCQGNLTREAPSEQPRLLRMFIFRPNLAARSLLCALRSPHRGRLWGSKGPASLQCTRNPREAWRWRASLLLMRLESSLPETSQNPKQKADPNPVTKKNWNPGCRRLLKRRSTRAPTTPMPMPCRTTDPWVMFW